MECAIIIVNYRTPDLVVDALASLSDQIESDGWRVIVVDNCSGDDSIPLLQNAIIYNGWQDWVKVIESPSNGGFSYGNNLAIIKILHCSEAVNFIWLLNPDTIVQPGAFIALLSFMKNNPAVGIAGSRLEDPDGTVQISAFRDHSVISEMLSGLRIGKFDQLFNKYIVAQPAKEVPHQADWLAGASIMVRREVLDAIGLFDEGYFLYFEEVDLCLRARRAGWNCWYVPESRVVHLVGAASGISDYRKKAPRRPSYWFESRRRFFLKNYGVLQTSIADLLWMVGYSMWRLRRLIQRKPDLDPPQFLSDFFRHSVISKGFQL